MTLAVVEALSLNLDVNANFIPNVDDQSPPIIKLTNARHHASMLSHF